MKNIAILIIIIGGLASCKFAAKEMKKVNQIRRSAKQVCDCKYVNVESDYDMGNNSVTITVRRSNSADMSATADSILLNVKKDFANLCNHDEIFIIFEGEEYDVEYTYYGCDLDKTIDTFYYDYDEFEDFESDSLYEEFEEIP